MLPTSEFPILRLTYKWDVFTARWCVQPPKCAFMDFWEFPWHETTCCLNTAFQCMFGLDDQQSLSQALLVSNASNICRLSHLFTRAPTKLMWSCAAACQMPYVVSTWWGIIPLWQMCCKHLNEIFGYRWTERDGPVSWPPRSPDLSSMDCFLWCTLKNVCKQHPWIPKWIWLQESSVMLRILKKIQVYLSESCNP